MPTTTPDFLDSKRSEIENRLGELRPLVFEYQRLQAAADAIDAVPSPQGNPVLTPLAVNTGDTPSPPPATRPRKQRGRPKGTGNRRGQALAIVIASPGITIPEMADRMGIKQNYLYRVLPGLAGEGLVRKDGSGWHPVDPAPAAA